MLNQLNRLSIEADGRYATPRELQFLKEYLQSIEQRASAYEKIKAAEENILKEVETKLEAIDPNLFTRGNRDLSGTCRRDRKILLRHLALTTLLGDRDRLRDSLLLWLQTILRAFKFQHPADLTHQVMSPVVEQHLTSQENDLFQPGLNLSHNLLR